MNIRKVLQSGDVVRFHNHAGIDKQKISEHQWGVALILQYIYPECSKAVLLAALTHDAAEYFTGDIPAPVKWASPELRDVLNRLESDWEKRHGIHYDLHPDEHAFLKLADTLDGMWYCITQVRHGNINAKRPFRKWRSFVVDFIHGLDFNSKQLAATYELIDNFTREMEEL